MNKNDEKTKFLNQLLLTWKKIRMDLLFSLAEIKCIHSNHGVFKSFAINQSESSINYKEIFIFSDIIQSESIFNGHGIFNKFYVNQPKLSSTSHGFFNNFNIKWSELNILLVTLFVGNHPIRIKHFLKVNCLLFLKRLSQYLKNVYQKTSKFSRVTLQEKKIPIDFLIDEIDVEYYFYHNFLDVYVVQNRVLRLSKGLFRETYSIKEFTCDPHIACQSFKLTVELHLTRKEILFILDNLKIIKKSYDNISKSLFIIYPIPKFVKKKIPSKILYSFISLRIFKVKNPAWFGLESDFQSFALKNSSNWVILPSLHENQRTWLSTLKSRFSHWLHRKNSIILMKKFVEMLLVCYSFVTFISKISYV